MNLITKNNYEAYLLDYIEGNLSPELIAELMLFFENNPELKEDIDSFEIHQLKPTKSILESKEGLKKEELITLLNYEDFIIAEIEGVNTKEESLELQLFLNQQPNKQVDFDDYKKTKLIASSIIFEDKKLLKKRERKVIPLWWYTSAAAVVLILFLVKGLDFENSVEETAIANEVIEKEPIDTLDDVMVIEKEEEIEAVNIATNEIEKSPHYVKTKKEQKENPVIVPQKETIEYELAKNELKKNDDVQDSLPVIKNIELPDEEVLIADNVVITYEEEEKKPEQTEAPISRFKLIKEILNQRVKKKIFQQERNNNGEVTAYAVDVSGVGFTRNRRKNKK